jgi:hypothetical protein
MVVLRALPSNGRCLHCHCLATGLYATIPILHNVEWYDDGKNIWRSSLGLNERGLKKLMKNRIQRSRCLNRALLEYKCRVLKLHQSRRWICWWQPIRVMLSNVDSVLFMFTLIPIYWILNSSYGPLHTCTRHDVKVMDSIYNFKQSWLFNIIHRCSFLAFYVVA